MSGSDTATLSGVAVPISFLKRWDHTYVVSDCGWAWSCGRVLPANGQAVCAGIGSSFIANCISKPNGTAGIVYGVTGVCHQKANRILLPSLTLVDRARGYRWSERLYGDYGTDELQWLSSVVACYAAPPDSDLLNTYEGPVFQTSSLREAIKMSDRPASVNEVLRFIDTRRSETSRLSEICREAEVEVSPDQKSAIVHATSRLRDEQAKLASRLKDGLIEKSLYLQKIKELMSGFAQENLQILGEKPFYAIYGEAALDPECVIDENTFLEDEGSSELRTKPPLGLAG